MFCANEEVVFHNRLITNIPVPVGRQWLISYLQDTWSYFVSFVIFVVNELPN